MQAFKRNTQNRNTEKTQTYLKQVAIITIKEYIQSNKELSEDDPGNSMNVDDYINMLLGIFSDHGNKKVESVELFYEGISNAANPSNVSAFTPIAAIHYIQYI